MGKVYVNDEGTEIILDTGIDLSGVIEKKIIAKRPITGDYVEFNNSQTSVFETTKLKATVDTASGTPGLDEKGVWTFHAWVKMSNFSAHGEAYKREIFSLGT